MNYAHRNIAEFQGIILRDNNLQFNIGKLFSEYFWL